MVNKDTYEVFGAEPQFFATSEGEIHGLVQGEPDAPLVLAVHGGIGRAENFLELGARLSTSYRVVSLDLPGRGASFWPDDPIGIYRFSRFVDLICEVLDDLGVAELRWIGTSMGGALGIQAAAGPLRARITHLVLNDIGPTMPEHLIESLRVGFASQPVFPDLAAAAQYLRGGLGALAVVPRDESFWRRRARQYVRRLPDGRFTLHHDPNSTHQLVAGRDDFELWPAFRSIDAKTLVIHAGHSQILTAEIVSQMKRELPAVAVAEYPEWGHAPFLDTEGDFRLLAEFLAG